jgi:hypothetical protein
MIYVAKIFSIVLGMMVISKTYLDFRKKQESLIMFLFWSIAWIAIIYISLYPIVIDQTIAKLGRHKTGTGTFFAMALVFMLFLSYRIYNKANRVENKLREIVTKLGLKNLEK